jgi:hypothetical protein
MKQQTYSLFNFEIDSFSQKQGKSRVGLLYHRTGVPVFLIYLKGIEKGFSIPISSLNDVDQLLRKEDDPHQLTAWKMIRCFFEAGGSKAQVCVCPLKGSSSAEYLNSMIGEDQGFNRRSGIYSLSTHVERADLVVIPQGPLLLNQEDYHVFCQVFFQWIQRQRNFFAILDVPRGMLNEEVKEWSKNLHSEDAALYYPWILRQGEILPSAPYIAAVFQTSDQTSGLNENPTNLPIQAEVIPLIKMSAHQSTELNQERINSILSFKDEPALVWGAKTLTRKHTYEYQFIANRRTIKHLEEAITSICDHYVLEPLKKSTLSILQNELDDFCSTHKYLFNDQVVKPFQILVSQIIGSHQDGILVDCDFYLNTCIENVHLSIGVDL